MKRKNILMKQYQKWLATGLALASGLLIANSVQAQPWQTPPPAGAYTTTVLTDFSNFNLSALYAAWAPFPAGSASTVITSGATPGSYEVASLGYGSGAYDFPSAVSAPGAMYAQLTFTVNNSGFGYGDTTTLGNINPQFDINSSGVGNVAYSGGGPGYAAGTTYTFTVPLNPAAAAAIGETAPGTVNTSIIYGFNLENAGYNGTGNYDVTYGSLVLLTPVPEPTTLALLAIGATGLVIARRRAKVS
jgi:PEP-CTERM motif